MFAGHGVQVEHTFASLASFAASFAAFAAARLSVSTARCAKRDLRTASSMSADL